MSVIKLQHNLQKYKEGRSLCLMKYKLFGCIKYMKMNEGGSHSIKHKSNQPHLMKDKASLNWEWPAQQQESWGSQCISYEVWMPNTGPPPQHKKKSWDKHWSSQTLRCTVLP